ncbi:MAG: hypothetical protein E6R04_01295 [Spirochaetes bacterium]|nr:MAG: hypothetical protein E6R04_01295 [Spirochaetota bacterium]
MENNIVVTGSTPEFCSWLEGVKKIATDYRAKNFPTLSAPIFTIEEGSKFIRVVTEETTGTARSVYCFIAKVDSKTKALGEVKAGDVLKSASWKAPAAIARGNIFDPSNGLAQCNAYGANYR